MAGRFEHRLHCFAVELPGAHLVAHRPFGVTSLKRRAVGTRLPQRVVGIGGAQDPGRQRDGVAPQPARVAGAVQPLMVQRRAVPDLRQQRRAGQHPLGQVRVSPGPLALGDAPLARLIPDTAGNPDHADVMHQRRPAQHHDIGRRKPEHRAGLGGQFGHSPGMAKTQRRLQVTEVGEGRQRPVKLVVSQYHAQLRVQRDHLIPRRDVPEPVEDLAVPGTETIHQIWIELRAPPLAGYAQRGLGAPSMVERLDEVGQVDQADGGSKTLGTGRTGHPSPVPPFECLQQRLAHRRPELQPPGEIARRLAVRHHHLLHRAARGGQELADHPDPAETRLTAAEMTGDE